MEVLSFYYENYKGQKSVRKVVEPKFMYKYSQWHSKSKEDKVWLIFAYDLEKEDFREFALKDIICFISEDK